MLQYLRDCFGSCSRTAQPPMPIGSRLYRHYCWHCCIGANQLTKASKPATANPGTSPSLGSFNTWFIRFTLGFLTEETARYADPTFVEPVGQRMNLQFACESPAEVDAVHAKLIAAGHESHTAPWDAYWGQRFARIKDTDGNIVNLFA
jgi:hypothetical protein